MAKFMLKMPKDMHQNGSSCPKVLWHHLNLIFNFQDNYVYTYHTHANRSFTLYDKQRIGDRFPGVQGPVDVAVIWSFNDKTYLISGKWDILNYSIVTHDQIFYYSYTVTVPPKRDGTPLPLPCILPNFNIYDSSSLSNYNSHLVSNWLVVN